MKTSHLHGRLFFADARAELKMEQTAVELHPARGTNKRSVITIQNEAKNRFILIGFTP